MAEMNHTGFDQERSGRVLNALSTANELSECIYFIADAFQGRPNPEIALVATEHLTRLLCRHLDVLHRELFQASGFGSFESYFETLRN